MSITQPVPAFLITLGIADLYERLPPNIQQKIRGVLNLHHGTIGAIIALISVLSGSLLWLGIGSALMLHDRKDAQLWKKDIERMIAILKTKYEQWKNQQTFYREIRVN